MLHCHRIAHFAVRDASNELYKETLTNIILSKAGQQIILIEGADALPPAPEYIKHLTHSEFVPPLRYGPLD